MSNQESNNTEWCGQPLGMCDHCNDLGCIHNPWWDHLPADEGGDNK